MVIFYARVSGNWVGAERTSQLLPLSHLTLGLVLLLFGLGAGSAIAQLTRLAQGLGRSARAPILAILGEPLATRRGRYAFLGIFALYFTVFGWATGILIIRPGQDFTADYGVAVPSAQIFTCCGSPGTVPIYVVYAAQGVGLLVTPATLLFALVVSLLAGLSLSISLAAFAAWRSYYRGIGSAGLAGIVGFLAACPSCAVQVLLAAFAGPASSAIASALNPWQLYLAMISAGLMIATLWAQGRWIRNSRACEPRPRLGAAMRHG